MSRTLFNENGVQSTAMFKIASDLGMSPGNLTYHFKSKSDIVRELAQDLERDIASALYGLKVPVESREVVSCLADILQTLWASRFFFNSALFVSRMDDDLADKIQHLHRTICDVISVYNARLIQRKEMRSPRPPNTVRLLSENVVAIWLQWLRFQNIATPHAATADRQSVAECMRHHFSLMEPYLSRGFAEEFDREISSQFG